MVLLEYGIIFVVNGFLFVVDNGNCVLWVDV